MTPKQFKELVESLLPNTSVTVTKLPHRYQYKITYYLNKSSEQTYTLQYEVFSPKITMHSATNIINDILANQSYHINAIIKNEE